MFRVYINQHHAWLIQDSVIEMQQNARASIDELTRQLRQTGYNLPNGLPALEASDTNPDTIVIVYKAAGDCDATIEHAMPQPSAELRCDGHDVSCFWDGQEIYIYDPYDQTGEFFIITEVQVAAAHVQHRTMRLSKAYPKGSILLSLDRVKFYIDQSDTLHPKLMVQVGNNPAQIYAEDVIDLQFTYNLKNGMEVSVPAIESDVREIGITVTARTSEPDVEFPDDPYRFETYQSRVFLRNLGM
jgi:Tfp pilus assembly protein PilW